MVTVHGQYAQFRFFRPQAKSVYLAGDFTRWNAGQVRMVPSGGGYWVAVLRLPEGAYKFRYSADGQWFLDYASFGIEEGPFGPDSVVRIGPTSEAGAGGVAPQQPQYERRIA